ncbi:hypothetical protein AB0D86_47830 [Streptomyces sp. NPDC048324]|uniref:alpha/beta fold hydrolase n=1 Tax=Streptomyces sp. NPDC048324 TaxID=3157205 RepID=UPI00341E22FD
MAKIVGIHGIGQEQSGDYQLGAAWYQALRSGLSAAGEKALAEDLPDKDVRVAFFGDLFRQPGELAAVGPEDLEGPEAGLLAEFYAAALKQDPALQPPPEALGMPGSVPLEDMLDELLRSRIVAGVVRALFVRSLRQVTDFLDDAQVKEDVLARVQELISEDTRILVGHSLGSVVAYEYLCRDRSDSVRALVTLGSPLGIPNLIFDRLTPPPEHGRGRWPSEVARWTNVADPHDWVALKKQLVNLFPSTQPGRQLRDLIVDNGSRPHAVDRYLNKAQTGKAIADALKQP